MMFGFEKCKWEHSCGYELCMPEFCKEYEAAPMTNADKIRSMTDEKLAVLLDCFSACAVCREAERLDDNPFFKEEKCDEDCEMHILEWLKQPFKENTDE